MALATAYLQPKRVLALHVSGVNRREGDYMHALKLVFDS